MASQTNKEYSVNWKNHMSHVLKAFSNLRNSNELTDVTLCCEGKKVGAHKILLSACSTYFRDIFKDVPCKHPVIFLYGVEYTVLTDILHFIYNGEVSVDTAKLDLFLKTAQQLQISGLTDDFGDQINNCHSEQNEASEQGIERNFTTSAQCSTNYVERQRGTKRQKTLEARREKVTNEENEVVFEAEVKCEPNELINYVEISDDPLQDPQQDPPEFYSSAAGENTGEDEFKIERSYFDSTRLLESEQKVRHSNFSEDCLKCAVCNKIFSHPYSLHHHKAVHSGNTKCPICNVVLSRKYNLKMHMKARHNI